MNAVVLFLVVYCTGGATLALANARNVQRSNEQLLDRIEIVPEDPGAELAAVTAVELWLADERPSDVPVPSVRPVSARAEAGAWLATVQVSNPRSCWTVRVTVEGEALLPPTPAACLPEPKLPTSSSFVTDDSPQARTAGQFVTEWLTGGPVDRFVAEGVRLERVATFADATVQSLTRSGDVVHVIADVALSATHSVPVAVDVRVAFIDPRWEVTSVAARSL